MYVLFICHGCKTVRLDCDPTAVYVQSHGSTPIEVLLTFVFRRGTNGEILDCIPQLNDFFPADELARRRVGRRGRDSPFELWYHKNQMQLGIEERNSVNDTIVGLTGFVQRQKLWYGPIIALILQRDWGNIAPVSWRDEVP
ncbi:uncharacterized protein BT62DRAFT_924505 [Guyanagaster necrorhizus]|uniref:Uncharacterized protein n=1 Tax=Guyanagaster necrorhizus TaxID=856835 RepID=A0A9P7VFG3_9AGAR|nr:uncharacterized protein BT62DRAFT_924505 [Guyanagaster necrorhizus MCA 3950]KAG7439734.1 hypothetical protein BT62DRAFT_924505 [Guyanagaster necrorhizus MCA 3950]